MRRSFGMDPLKCPNCGDRMVLISSIDDPAIIHRIFIPWPWPWPWHLGMPTTGPPQKPPWRKQTELDFWDEEPDRHRQNDSIDPPSFAE